MKTPILSFLLGTALFASACSSSSSSADMTTTIQDHGTTAADLTVLANADLTMGEPMLTVNNTISWCTVTVTVGSQAAVMFGGASQTFAATAGTTVMLTATPKPSFFPVMWTGTTTMSGDSATYVMTSAASQSVTACCPTSAAGGGC